jgi:radical SAM protein with 4Fe4S-binding SPASM domain
MARGDDPRLSVEKFLECGPANIYYNRALDAKDPSSDHLYGERLLIPPRFDGYANWLSKTRCLNSVLTLSANGDYHFCEDKMHQSCGHVREKTLQQIFADIESENSSWEPAAEKESCAECEFNVACHICKARDLHIGRGDTYCGYDPGTGCWQPQIDEKR